MNAQAQPYYGYNSYEPEYIDKKYSSYEPQYGMDNNNYQKSYGKDNRDKSKDSSKSVNINKIKCINTNININGNNAGNVSIGNKDGVAAADAEGYSGAYSYDGERYDDGNNKGFDCIINNNNNNVTGGGNQTTPPEPSKATLNVTKLVTCQYILGNGNPCPQLTSLITEDQFLIEVYQVAYVF